MRLLIVSATNQRRGAETQAMGLAARLRSSGISVGHVALSLIGKNNDLPIEGLGRTWKSLRTLIRLRQRAKEADLVIAFGSTSLPACAIGLFGSGIPFVYRSIGDPGQWVRGPLHRWRTGLLLRRAQHVAALWQGAADSIKSLYRIPADRISVIPNARAVEDYPLASPRTREVARRTFGLAADDTVVSVVGSLTKEKCVECAIQVAACDPGLTLLIVGDGEMRATLEVQAQLIAPGRVRFLGIVDNIKDVYAASDLLLITSRTEGMPGAAIEAGLCGVPVVSTEVGAIREVVEDRASGRVISDWSVTDGLEAIYDVLERRSLYGASLSATCRELFTWDSVISQWISLLESRNERNEENVRR